MAQILKNEDLEALGLMKKAVADYIKIPGNRFGGKRIMYKFILFALVTIGCYIGVLNLDSIQLWNSLLQTIIFIALYFVFGLCFAGIGFNVTHDASHKTFSSIKWLNRAMLHSLEIMGASSTLWVIKHVIVHHTKTNTKDDDDLNSWPVLRLHTTDKRLWHHRYQKYYASIAYSLLFIIWVHGNDYAKYFKRRIKNHEIKVGSFELKDHLIFWIGKLIVHPTLFFVIPGLYIGFLNALIGYVIMGMVCGVVISYVFQLAHVVEDTVEIEESEESGNLVFMRNQILSTSNFSTENKLLTFLFGGLNFQIEHHLFPYVSHVHYPKISKIIKPFIEKAGLKYNELSFGKAILSHLNKLDELGKNDYPLSPT